MLLCSSREDFYVDRNYLVARLSGISLPSASWESILGAQFKVGIEPRKSSGQSSDLVLRLVLPFSLCFESRHLVSAFTRFVEPWCRELSMLFSRNVSVRIGWSNHHPSLLVKLRNIHNNSTVGSRGRLVGAKKP